MPNFAGGAGEDTPIGAEVDGAALGQVRRADGRLGVQDETGQKGRGKNEQAHGPKVRAVNLRPR